jgi:hypothetical protein
VGAFLILSADADLTSMSPCGIAPLSNPLVRTCCVDERNTGKVQNARWADLVIPWAYASRKLSQRQRQSARQATAFFQRRVGADTRMAVRARLGLAAVDAVGGARR